MSTVLSSQFLDFLNTATADGVFFAKKKTGGLLDQHDL